MFYCITKAAVTSTAQHPFFVYASYEGIVVEFDMNVCL
ncbi:hypothetical protein HBHAL_2213 [Halobacillus halophilus DSM 2266]|uniref:Uncharacterized protein n=1 Tax=Halobacillus halophilus (strain ATCC 35676 / DSM 2266 / JCM 20832 / KCTC 3685 / LMG 17431 / NBRC 102448 / NCIMB 2269) TaxID=866895 RepID=I0JK97_HALH3|nr:hypothetical protein HBHAL_2213 [Halobacillus halophilus DSM 2266]